MTEVEFRRIVAGIGPRNVAALELLQQPDPETNLPIIGGARPVVPINRDQPQWGPVWKKTPWIILPPEDLIRACSVISVRSQPLLAQKTVSKTKRIGKKTTPKE